jgi:hypothetical protein
VFAVKLKDVRKDPEDAHFKARGFHLVMTDDSDDLSDV